MKRIGKPIFFIVAAFILIFTTVAFTGISSTYGDITKTYVKGVGDIRWGIDIRGGVDVTFTPSTDATRLPRRGPWIIIRPNRSGSIPIS